MRRPPRWPLALLLLLSALPSAHARGQSLGFGLMAGGSLSTFTGRFTDDVRNYGGFIAGAFVHAGVAGFAVEPGLFYTRKGAKSTSGNIDFTNKLDYVQIPLVIKLSMPFGPATRLYVGGGPAIGIKVGCKVAVAVNGESAEQKCGASGDEESGFEDARATQFGAIGVAGLDLGKFSVGLRADFDVSKTFKSVNDLSDLKTRTLSAVAAIRF